MSLESLEAKVKKPTRIAAAIWLLMAFAVETHASIFYSTDLDLDQLVLIDSADGSVTTVGPLGFDSKDVDLVRVGDRLFALNSDFELRVDLHELDPNTGASISAVQVHTPVENVLLAEGLAQVNGQLKIGFRVAGAPFTTQSNALGDLGFDGLITNVQTNASSFTTDLDFDGLVDGATGQIYGLDGSLFGAPNDTKFFTVSESPLATHVFYTNTSVPPPSLDDIVVLGNTLFAVGDQTLDQFHFLDLTTNQFSGIMLDRGGDFSGLALANVPELSSIAVWGLGIVIWFACKASWRGLGRIPGLSS
jgi:hypothetical protein